MSDSESRPVRCDGCGRPTYSDRRIEDLSASLCGTCSDLLDRTDRDPSDPWDHYKLREDLLDRVDDVEECDRCEGRGLVGGPHHATMSDCPSCSGSGIEEVGDR